MQKRHQFHSQHGQDKFIYNTFFRGKKDGVFVDIGAADGVAISNTLFFEKDLGWHGVCVEPHTQYYKKLVKNRPNSHCVEGCISDFTGKGTYMEITGYPRMLSGLVDKYDERHIQRIEDEIREMGGKSKKRTVKCYRISDILDKQKIKHVDFLSIDVEGPELDILKTIDFNKYPIDVLTIENNYNEPTIKKFLGRRGYRLVKQMGTDEIYTRRSGWWQRFNPANYLG